LVKLESLVLCDNFQFSEDGNNQLTLYGVGGIIFTASFPRGLCYLYARVLLPHLDQQSEYVLKAALVRDELPDQAPVYIAIPKAFRRVPQPFSRKGDFEPTAAVFDFNDAMITKPGHYTIKVYCGGSELGSTKFELRDVPTVGAVSVGGVVSTQATTTQAIKTQY
jgi:hypothetical protein